MDVIHRNRSPSIDYQPVVCRQKLGEILNAGWGEGANEKALGKLRILQIIKTNSYLGNAKRGDNLTNLNVNL